MSVMKIKKTRWKTKEKQRNDAGDIFTSENMENISLGFRCSFIWKIWVVYFSIKHSYLCNKKWYQSLQGLVSFLIKHALPEQNINFSSFSFCDLNTFLWIFDNNSWSMVKINGHCYIANKKGLWVRTMHSLIYWRNG